MGRHRLGLTVVVAVGMTAAVAAGTTAQVDRVADGITIVQGTVVGEPFDVSLASWDPVTDQMTGLALSIPVESTDPRLTGTMSVATSGAGRQYGEGGIRILQSTFRLTTDDGAWVGEGWEAEARRDVDDGEAAFHSGAMLLEGEGAYDGLTAYILPSYDDEVPTIEGVIIENTLPPAPDPISPVVD